MEGQRSWWKICSNYTQVRRNVFESRWENWTLDFRHNRCFKVFLYIVFYAALQWLKQNERKFYELDNTARNPILQLNEHIFQSCENFKIKIHKCKAILRLNFTVSFCNLEFLKIWTTTTTWLSPCQSVSCRKQITLCFLSHPIFSVLSSSSLCNYSYVTNLCKW